jgi:hypothetical protein
MPIVEATDAALDGYGRLVDDPSACSIEIVRWPSTGVREVDGIAERAPLMVERVMTVSRRSVVRLSPRAPAGERKVGS